MSEKLTGIKLLSFLSRYYNKLDIDSNATELAIKISMTKAQILSHAKVVADSGFNATWQEIESELINNHKTLTNKKGFQINLRPKVIRRPGGAKNGRGKG